MTTDIYLIRHGEPVLTGALLGATDSPLSDKGWQQLTDTFQHLPSFDHLVSSSLSRCAAFAQDYSAVHSMPMTIDAQWRECHFGQWDGVPYQTLHKESPHAVEKFFNDPYRNTPPEGESLENFHQRILTALLHLVDQHNEKKIAILCHAGVIRTLVAWCLNMDYRQGDQFKRFSIDYGSLTHLRLFNHASSDNQNGRYFAQLQSLNAACSNAKNIASHLRTNHD